MRFTAKYNSTYADRAYEVLYEGHTIHMVCRELKICKQTFYTWKKEHPDFNEAVEHGIVASLAHWEELGMNGIIADGFNVGAYIVQMRNRFGWKAQDGKDDGSAENGGVGQLTAAFIAAQEALKESKNLKKAKKK